MKPRCDYLYVLYRGRVVESGSTEHVLTMPKDPYTIRLLQSVPTSDTGWLSAPESVGADLANG